METYIVLETVGNDGKASVKRVSDGKLSRCKLSWLESAGGDKYRARSKTKAIRLDGLEWTTEG